MKKSQFTEEQIAYALHEVEVGTPAAEICRKLGVSEQTFYRWKRNLLGWVSLSYAASSNWRRRTASSNS
jgi:hypothetical protein